MTAWRDSVTDVLALAVELSEQEDLRAAVIGSVEGGIIAGVLTACGGLLGGPLGLAVGGAVGGVVAAAVSRKKFKSVASIIMNDLSSTQKKKLVATLTNVIPSQLALMSASQLPPELKQQIIDAVKQFFGSHLNMHVE
ncbi:protein C19orf12 homolog [Penaeus chinensis]|uniref:protein C19orf12 homolog n=1 Tax=Penaeus chinensis TaxID=139456 RepID=UPI001FB73458|nr:protein C19orf12 homolog [Penaeus chinensis]XP_047487741.1 protein C19orf12 homolog [Penaeus chinensis]